MIIRLKTANFSENNIGELNKFTVRVHGSGLASYEANSPVNKGETATIKVIVNSDFITDDITVKMSGSVITPSITSTGTNEYTITIPNVTGRIEVLVGDVVSGGGSGDVGGSGSETETLLSPRNGLITGQVGTTSVGNGFNGNTSDKWAYARYDLDGTYSKVRVKTTFQRTGHNAVMFTKGSPAVGVEVYVPEDISTSTPTDIDVVLDIPAEANRVYVNTRIDAGEYIHEVYGIK